MSFAAPMLTIASTAFSAYGQAKAGKDTQKAYEQEAQQVEASDTIKLEEMAQQGQALLSTQRAMYTKSGVRETGTPLEVALQSATDIEFDKMVEHYNAETKAQSLRYSGQMAKQESQFQVGKTLLSGASKLISSGAFNIPTSIG
jgi:hypothetical protein